MEEVPNKREESEGQNAGRRRCRKWWRKGTPKRTEEKKDLGRDENQQSKVLQKPRKEKVLSGPVRFQRRRKNEDGGQAFLAGKLDSDVLRGGASMEGGCREY